MLTRLALLLLVPLGGLGYRLWRSRRHIVLRRQVGVYTARRAYQQAIRRGGGDFAPEAREAQERLARAQARLDEARDEEKARRWRRKRDRNRG